MNPEPPKSSEDKNVDLMLDLAKRKFGTQESAVTSVDTKIGIALGVIATFILPKMVDLPRDYPGLLHSWTTLVGFGSAFFLVIASVGFLIWALWVQLFLDPPAFKFLDPDNYGNTKHLSLKKGYLFQFRKAYNNNAPVLAEKGWRFNVGIILLFLGMLSLLITTAFQNYMTANHSSQSKNSVEQELVTNGDEEPAQSSPEPATGSGSEDVEHMGPPYGDYLQKGANSDGGGK